MATITATVTWQGTKHDVTVRPVDQLAYERVARQLKWPMPGNDALGPITYLGWLCWHSLKRTGVLADDVTWDRFVDEVDDIDGGDDDADTAVPTQTAASPEHG